MFTKSEEMKFMLYKNAPEEVKAKVKSIRKRWLAKRNFWGKLFSFQLRKVYLRFEGLQKTGSKEVIFYVWTIIYNQDTGHKNNTTIVVRFEDLIAKDENDSHST